MHIFIVRCQCRMFHKYFNFEKIEMVFVLATPPPPTPLPTTLIIFYSPSKVKCCYSEAQ